MVAPSVPTIEEAVVATALDEEEGTNKIGG